MLIIEMSNFVGLFEKSRLGSKEYEVINLLPIIFTEDMNDIVTADLEST